MILADLNDPIKYSKLAFSLDRIFKGKSVDSLKTKKVFVTRDSKKEEEERSRIMLNNMGKLDQLYYNFQHSSDIYMKLPLVINRENQKGKSRNEKATTVPKANSM